MMLLGDGILVAAGGSIAAMLLAIGLATGMRLGRRQQKNRDNMTQLDRERVLLLLQELGTWTNEYSGNVSEYQQKLVDLSDAIQRSASPTDSEDRVAGLLKQIMQSNGDLKTRLDAAERQLEKQTKQIEAYLTEARTDGLTGLYNRRAFDKRLDELFAGYRGGGRSFVVVLIDIDHFKSVNDNHGHPVGDQVLQQLATILNSQLAGALMVARYGGEEFAVIMDGPLRIAAAKMNEVRKAIAREPMDAGKTQLDITISVGLSEPRDDIVASPVVRRADESLYAAKNIGRNRVYYDDGRGPTLVGAAEISRQSD